MNAPSRARPATPADLDSLLALEESTFASDRIRRRQWRRYISAGSARVLVIGAPGDVRAAAVIFFRRNSRSARLYSLAVRHNARGSGLGRTLLAAAEADARARGCTAMRLEVRIDNRLALAFYRQCRFQQLERLHGFYEDGADAWRCAKSLNAVSR